MERAVGGDSVAVGPSGENVDAERVPRDGRPTGILAEQHLLGRARHGRARVWWLAGLISEVHVHATTG